MPMKQPQRPSDNSMYQLLLEEKIDEFNKKKSSGETCELAGVDLRGIDLRGLDAAGLDLRDAYMRKTDLRGIDLRDTQLEGASLMAANISGAYFPNNLHPREVIMSVEHGTRLRVRV